MMTLRGARMILAPAAFNMTTGPAHWELLLRQRAVDNQLFTVGTAPARDESSSYVAWGHSMVCEPWGGIVHQCGTGGGGRRDGVGALPASTPSAVSCPFCRPGERICTRCGKRIDFPERSENMKRYEDMTADQRREEYAAVRKAYEAQKALGLKLNMARGGSPARSSLDMVTRRWRS